MKNFKSIYIFTFIITIISSNLCAKDSSRFSVGLGIFNYMEDGSPPHNDQSGMINLELHSGRKMFNLIKPFAGFLGTNENAYYAYGGFGIDMFYRFKNNARIGVGIFHISNADSGKKNPGSETLVLKYQIPMGR